MLKYSPSLRKKKKKNISTSNGMHKYYVIAESNVFWSKTFVTNDVLIILWWIGTRQISRWGFFLVWFVSSFLCASLLIRILLCIFHVLQNFFFLFFSIFAFYAVFLSFLHSFYLSIYSFFFFFKYFFPSSRRPFRTTTKILLSNLTHWLCKLYIRIYSFFL